MCVCVCVCVCARARARVCVNHGNSSLIDEYFKDNGNRLLVFNNIVSCQEGFLGPWVQREMFWSEGKKFGHLKPYLQKHKEYSVPKVILLFTCSL
jgi:hypothetical protein